MYYNSCILIYVLYKRELINSFETIEYSFCIMMSMVIGPKWSFYSCCDYIRLLGTCFMQMLYLGKAPSTKETLPDFLKWRRVTRHPLVFRGLNGSQRTLGFGASHPQTCICRKLSFQPLNNSKGFLGIALVGTRFNICTAIFRASDYKY